MIIFSSVSKQFLPESFALKEISFEIDPGELVLLTGPSGSGKTTVMKLLTKEYDPTSGEILFHNTSLEEIKNSKIHEHRRKIGVVFQDYKLIPELNVWENIALPLSIIGKSESEIESRVTDLLELVSLTDKAFLFPTQLSGGEAQRISIARALSTAPSIIFADEPTGNLDKENSLLIAKLLTKINELGTTILFATHDHDVIDLLGKQRHIILNNGELITDTKTKNKKEENTKKTEETVKAKSEKTEETVKTKSEKTSKESDKVTEKIDTKEAEQKTEPENDEAELTSEVIKKPTQQGFFAKLFGKKEADKEKETDSEPPSQDLEKNQEESTKDKKTETTAKKIKKKKTTKKS